MLRLVSLFFILVSFWPWEQDSEQLKKSSLEIPSSSSLLDTLRVALFYELPKVTVGTTSRYEIKGIPNNTPLTEGPSPSSLILRPDPSGIRVGPTLYPVSGVRITTSAKEIQIGNRKYHNALQVLKNPAGSLTIVNEIGVEDYLKGVLPLESNPDWPEEALKAQAVVSRTYAIFKNIENKDFPFALSSDVGSQVYGGKSTEKISSNRAVDKTRGEILTYRGRIFPAFFHSTCGGRTTRADYQWQIEPHPSLKGVECSFCRSSRHYTWKSEFAALEIQNLLAKKGRSLSDIRKITPDEVDISGRPHFFKIEHGGGSLKISANEFRIALGPERMRSTRVKTEREGDRFLFKGTGWGHGVGMCQFGAKHLAELGYRYTDILSYYYPDSEIRNLQDFPVSPVGTPVPFEEGEENIFKNWFRRTKSYVEDL